MSGIQIVTIHVTFPRGSNVTSAVCTLSLAGGDAEALQWEAARVGATVPVLLGDSIVKGVDLANERYAQRAGGDA